jgi:hypothetical protein
LKRIALLLAAAIIVLSLAACDIIISGSREESLLCYDLGSGDIDCNGIPYEPADAEMFINYFVTGLSAFGDHVDNSRIASNVDGHCRALSAADFVHLVRRISGFTPTYGSRFPVSAYITRSDEVFSVGTHMGAAYIVMSGQVTPTLLADNMEMRFGVVDDNTHILVFSTEPGNAFYGAFLQVAGEVFRTEFATYAGDRVVNKYKPASFEVSQNYPNPFNPTTTINFTVPGGGAWRIVIRNYTGATVAQFSGISETGFEDVIWDATGLPQGSYFYTVTAAGQSITKKAVYLR